MRKKTKKLTLYFTTGLLLITGGVKVKLCKDKSKQFTQQVISYTKDFENDDFQIAAHRGFSSLEVENTMEAIKLANKADYVDYIELDVRLTKDKKLVLSHSNSLSNTKNEILKISNEEYDKLINSTYYNFSNSLLINIQNIFNEENGDILTTRSKRLDNRKYEISSLKELLKSENNKKIILDLKFKDNAKGFVKELDKELKNTNLDNIIFQSDDLLSLLYLQQKHPNYHTLAVIKKKSDLDYMDLFDNFCLRKNLVTEKMCENLLSENKDIAIWTLNNPDEIDEVVDILGDNYKSVIYITDYPDVVATCLHEKKLKKEKTTQ